MTDSKPIAWNTRRSFLGSILALGAAPAIVRADALMRIVPRDAPLIVPEIGQIDGFKLMVIQVTAPTRKLNVRWRLLGEYV